MRIRIGTRKSRLALAQTELVKNAVKAHFPEAEIEIVHITTRGDRIIDRPLAEIGGKGLFITEIEQALLEERIDIAVHSAKDLPAAVAEGLEISGVLERADMRDCIVLRKGEIVSDSGDFIVGTGSSRRRRFMKGLFPNVEFRDIRGNVDTRISKLLDRKYDAVILAAAGLERLDCIRDERIDITAFEPSEFLPSPCQGIIAVESRKDSRASQYVRQISHERTYYAFETERYIIERAGGGCGIPLGAFSWISDEKIHITVSMDTEKILSGSDLLSNRLELAERLVREF